MVVGDVVEMLLAGLIDSRWKDGGFVLTVDTISFSFFVNVDVISVPVSHSGLIEHYFA